MSDAFPQPLVVVGGRVVSAADHDRGGMSLRDYFAGQALEGLLASPPSNGDRSRMDKDMMAARAYAWADAMLDAREQEDGDAE